MGVVFSKEKITMSNKVIKHTKPISPLGIWDYDIRKLDLTRPDVLRWYLERKIEYNDWKAIEYTALKRYLPELAIDEDKKKFLTNFIYWTVYFFQKKGNNFLVSALF